MKYVILLTILIYTFSLSAQTFTAGQTDIEYTNAFMPGLSIKNPNPGLLNSSMMRIYNDTNHALEIGVRSSTFAQGADNPYIAANNNRHIDIYTSGRPRLRVDSAGSFHFFNSESGIVESNLELVTKDDFSFRVSDTTRLFISNSGVNTYRNLSIRSPDYQELYGLTTTNDGDLRFVRNNNFNQPILTMLDDSIRVGIGTIDPSTELSIKQSQTPNLNGADPITNLGGLTIEDDDGSSATLFVDNSNDLDFAFGGVYKAYISDQTGEFISVSDRRLKQNINQLENILSSVLLLRPSKYQYKGYDHPEVTIGLIAQEVEKLFPEIVSTKDNIKALNYSAIGVIAIQAIQEQQALIENQAAQIAEQQEQIDRLSELISNLTNK